jgi:hypothetical protein
MTLIGGVNLTNRLSIRNSFVLEGIFDALSGWAIAQIALSAPFGLAGGSIVQAPGFRAKSLFENEVMALLLVVVLVLVLGFFGDFEDEDDDENKEDAAIA